MFKEPYILLQVYDEYTPKINSITFEIIKFFSDLILTPNTDFHKWCNKNWINIVSPCDICIFKLYINDYNNVILQLADCVTKIKQKNDSFIINDKNSQQIKKRRYIGGMPPIFTQETIIKNIMCYLFGNLIFDYDIKYKIDSNEKIINEISQNTIPDFISEIVRNEIRNFKGSISNEYGKFILNTAEKIDEVMKKKYIEPIKDILNKSINEEYIRAQNSQTTPRLQTLPMPESQTLPMEVPSNNTTLINKNIENNFLAKYKNLSPCVNVYDVDKRRLIFKYVTPNLNGILKISPRQYNYVHEPLIYYELNEFMKLHDLENNIVECVDSGNAIFDSKDLILNSKDLILHSEKNGFFSFKIYNIEIPDNMKDNTNIFIITIFDPDYMSLNKYLNTNVLDNNIIDSFLTKIINILNFLNNELGFIHWDLHSGNILVFHDENQLKFKLYDFDRSNTLQNPWNEANKTIKFDTSKMSSIHYFKFGYYYDISRLLLCMIWSKKINNLFSSNPIMKNIYNLLNEFNNNNNNEINNFRDKLQKLCKFINDHFNDFSLMFKQNGGRKKIPHKIY